MKVGIYSIGTYLPEEVRTNDHWSQEVVDRWWKKDSGRLDREADSNVEVKSEGAKLVMEMMAKYRSDPFKGGRARRVMAKDQTTTQMEYLAAEDAVARAEIDPKDIDLVMGQTTVPDYLMVPNACRVHEKLGLSRNCMTIQTEGLCVSFLQQLTLANQMIASGQARRALLIQSSGTTRFMAHEDPMSAWIGDAATAVVVGPVGEELGVLGTSHQTAGEFYDAVVAGHPDRAWHEGAVQAYIKDSEISRAMLLGTVEDSQSLIWDALRRASVEPHNVDFYACHQGFAWLREVTQKFAGLSHARTLDTFPWAGSVLACNIPLILATAEREKMINPGDTISMFAGATGALLASVVMRWGR